MLDWLLDVTFVTSGADILLLAIVVLPLGFAAILWARRAMPRVPVDSAAQIEADEKTVRKSVEQDCSPETERMGDYRAYILGIDGHRFVRANDFSSDHPNDAAAIDAARHLTDKHDVEVWETSRLVARLSPCEEAELAPSLPSSGEQHSVGQAEPITLSNVSKSAFHGIGSSLVAPNALSSNEMPLVPGKKVRRVRRTKKSSAKDSEKI